MNDQRGRKKDGRQTGREWCNSTSLTQQIEIAGCHFEYGETLDTLIQEGYDVPRSSDQDFSWGFYKQVKKTVHDAMYLMRKHQTQA